MTTHRKNARPTWTCGNCGHWVEHDENWNPTPTCPVCGKDTYEEHKVRMHRHTSTSGPVPIGMGDGINDIGPGCDGAMG